MARSDVAGTEAEAGMTIDELAGAAATTTRRVRSLQTLGLLPHPELRGRTGHYGSVHLDRLRAIVRLQALGFSLESLGVLFAALDDGQSLADVLGVDNAATGGELVARTPRSDVTSDAAELYGFADLQAPGASWRRARRPLISLVPTTMWEESQAS